MKKWLEANSQRLINIRRYLHQHPELGYKEYHTSDYLKNILQQARYDIIQSESMGTGFYTEYGQSNKPVLGIRCDLDALPIQDIKTAEYHSKNDGIMHACGHDVHMAIVTGFALWLKDSQFPISGRIRFIYQPAEEQAPGGALKMIDSGVINDIDHLIGIHMLPTLTADKIGIRYGTMSARVHLLELTLNGPGGHTSRPQETVNLISAAAQLVNAFENIAGKYSSTESPVVLSFGQISGGETFNVIPLQVALKGTLRYINADIEAKINKEVEDIVKKVSDATGAQIDLKMPYTVPMVKNNEQLTRLVADSAIDALGKQNVVFLEQSSMGSDDFGFYAQLIPSTFVRIGSANGSVRDLHVPDFDVDERCMDTAISVLGSIVKQYFE